MKNENEIAIIESKDLITRPLLHSAHGKPQWIGFSILILCFLVIISGCTKRYAYWNSPLREPTSSPVPNSFPGHASFKIVDNRGSQDVLVMLALSGGGSRAAYFSQEVMTKLQQDSDIDILKEVDVISSVSGGSLAAAYYAVSEDPEFIIPVPRCELNCDVFTEQPKIKCQKVGRKKQLLIGKLSPQEIEMAKNTLNSSLSGCSEKEIAYINRLLQLSQNRSSSNRIWISREQWNERLDNGSLSLYFKLRRDHVADLMSRNYIGRWVANWFWPVNIARYWFSAYDRSDIMAQTFEDNLFDTKNLGLPLTFADLNPERPYLIINSTDGTEAYGEQRSCPSTENNNFGSIFTFTKEDFKKYLRSDIYQFDVARAVMASAAFPAVFNYATLMDFTNKNDKRYHHVFDGGNADNLGLKSLVRVIDESNSEQYKHIIVILVDAFIEPAGKNSQDPDPRNSVSFIIDTNFMDSFDALLKNNRKGLVDNFVDEMNAPSDKFTFWHLSFTKIDKEEPDIEPSAKEARSYNSLRDGLNHIETDFRISDEDKSRIEKAVDILFVRDSACLERIKDILLSNNPDNLTLAPEPGVCRTKMGSDQGS